MKMWGKVPEISNVDLRLARDRRMREPVRPQAPAGRAPVPGAGKTRTGTPEYRAWQGMKTRCHNPNYSQYANYGGRGITVSPVWRNSFDAFLADVGRRPDPSYSLDRINPDGNYEPGNCRWTDRRTQSRNKARFLHPGLIPEDQR